MTLGNPTLTRSARAVKSDLGEMRNLFAGEQPLRMSLLKVGLSVLLVAGFTGCSSYSQWTEVDQDAPWGEDLNPATTWRRTETPSRLMVVGTSLSEESWRVNGKRVRTFDVAGSITRYLNRIGYIEKQKTTNGYSDGIQERVAEHRFFIVSLRPTVVIMTPYQVGKTEGRSRLELDGRLSQHALSSFPLINGYHYGTKVVRSPEYQWFSPDLSSGIQPAERVGEKWIIDNDSVRLVMTQSTSQDWVLVDRQR